jgi:hypothetical protein
VQTSSNSPYKALNRTVGKFEGFRQGTHTWVLTIDIGDWAWAARAVRGRSIIYPPTRPHFAAPTLTLSLEQASDFSGDVTADTSMSRS